MNNDFWGTPVQISRFIKDCEFVPFLNDRPLPHDSDEKPDFICMNQRTYNDLYKESAG